MIVYRIYRQKYNQPLSAYGASLYGGRWNSKETEILYTATNRSIAMVEAFVHITLNFIPSDYMLATMYIPDVCKINAISSEELPFEWNTNPPLIETQ